ncbi:hypothetical protein VRU48_02305 [Pedobacter sp. KR3-3]|uniref:VCBS repeat-containing protein n=1 Tax=Pedobacter albus TaxID=3113905 RepID=A0ABU7I374_9SPHI|nr:hypothetical protein [Pedobacter sp. KR3-3]MEE1943922.1 hypothetical protein [Pedobacter sp. KR3-3]
MNVLLKMRYLILIFCTCCFQLATAQTFSYPKLATQGKTIGTFVPNNWKAIDTAYGDLNNDGLEDMALVLEYNFPVTERRAYGDSETELIKEFQKPRILAIFFKQKPSNGYQLVLQNNNFILRSEEGGALGEPFKELSIKNNTLNLLFEGGNDWRWKLAYEFKYQHKQWALIKANNTYYNITSGEISDKTYDFIDRRLKQVDGNLFSRNAANIISEEILYFTDLRTLNDFKKPWTWEITKDNFL